MQGGAADDLLTVAPQVRAVAQAPAKRESLIAAADGKAMSDELGGGPADDPASRAVLWARRSGFIC